MAYFTVCINEGADPLGRTLHDKHYLRKHGSRRILRAEKKEKK